MQTLMQVQVTMTQEIQGEDSREAELREGELREDAVPNEEKQTLQDYVFDVREKIPDGIYKTLMEKYCYPRDHYKNEYSNDEELRECKDFIFLLHDELECLRSEGDLMWRNGYEERRIQEMERKKNSTRAKYQRKKELDQMTPEEKTKNIQLRKIDKKIDFENKKIELEEREIYILESRIIEHANKILMDHLVSNRNSSNRIDTNYISVQLRSCESEVKKKRAKLEKSNKAVADLLEKRNSI